MGTAAACSPASIWKCSEAGAVRGAHLGGSDKQAGDSIAKSRQGLSLFYIPERTGLTGEKKTKHWGAKREVKVESQDN